MRPDVVVPIPENGQINIELPSTRNDPLIEFAFQCAEEALDPADLPGAARIGALVADAELLQTLAEYAGGENRHFDRLRTGFVVGADNFGFAVGADNFKQAGEQSSRGFILQGLQVQ